MTPRRPAVLRASVVLLGAMLAAAARPSATYTSRRSPAVRCAAAKLSATMKKHRAKIRCHARAIRAGQAADPACLAAVEAKFVAAFARAEERGGCTTTGDASTVEAALDTCVDALVGLLSPHTTSSTTTTATTTTTTGPPSHACSPLFASCGGCPTCLCFGLPETGSTGICLVPFLGGSPCSIDPPTACPSGQVCVVTSFSPFVTFQCAVPCP